MKLKNKFILLSVFFLLIMMVTYADNEESTPSESRTETVITPPKTEVKSEPPKSNPEPKESTSGPSDNGSTNPSPKIEDNTETNGTTISQPQSGDNTPTEIDTYTTAPQTNTVNTTKSTTPPKQSKEQVTKKAVIDKSKPIKQAIDREIEVSSKYKGTPLIYVATTDGYTIEKSREREQHPMASLTKVMNILVALDEIDKGNVSLQDRVCFTNEIANIGGSWLNVKGGDCFTLEELLRTEIIYSANNSAYLVAHHVSKGNTDKYIELMNKKAQELGMKDTKFYTPAGLPTSMTGKGLDVSTPYDMYLMGKAAISDKRLREWTSEEEMVLLDSKGVQVIYPNRNQMLGSYGIFGLKTGHHDLAGYNLIATSTQGNVEVISVVMGGTTENNRLQIQTGIFENVDKKIIPVYNNGDEVGNFKIKYSKKKEIKGYITENISQLQGNEKELQIEDLKVSGKINKGTVIGKLNIIKNGENLKEIDIISNEDIEELSGFSKFIRFITFGLI